MVHPFLMENLLNYDNNYYFKIKLIFNREEIIKEHLMLRPNSNNLLSKWIKRVNNIIPKKLYKVAILFKAYKDSYMPSNENPIYFYKDERSINFFEVKGEKAKKVGDYCLFGGSSKKIILEETTETLYSIKFITDVNSPIQSPYTGCVYKIGSNYTLPSTLPSIGLLDDTDPFQHVKYEASKLLSKYVFNILCIEETNEEQITYYKVKICVNHKKSVLEILKQKLGW